MDRNANRGGSGGLFLIFHLDERLYGLPVCNLREIIPMVEITPVPNAPTMIKGVINLRGAIVPIVDLRQQLKLPEKNPDARTCIVVAESMERAFGFMADRVTDCLEIEDIKKPEDAEAGSALEGHFIYAIGQHAGRIVILLDPEKLLAPSDWAAVKPV